MGLVKQAVSALTKRKIMQLTHTYITLSLSGEPNMKVKLSSLVVFFSLFLGLVMRSLVQVTPVLQQYLHDGAQISPTRWG